METLCTHPSQVVLQRFFSSPLNLAPCKKRLWHKKHGASTTNNTAIFSVGVCVNATSITQNTSNYAQKDKRYQFLPLSTTFYHFQSKLVELKSCFVVRYNCCGAKRPINNWIARLFLPGALSHWKVGLANSKYRILIFNHDAVSATDLQGVMGWLTRIEVFPLSKSLVCVQVTQWEFRDAACAQKASKNKIQRGW